MVMQENLKPIKLSKKALNIIRTTSRNNVELVNIADNKANILLSINGIMFTALIPMLFSYQEIIVSEHLYIPLIVLASTLVMTIILCSTVLRPTDLNSMNIEKQAGMKYSPFFFENFHNIDSVDYIPFVKESLKDKDQLIEYILQDHYLVGRNLGRKYVLMKKAFQTFVAGVAISIALTIIVLAFF